MSAVFSLCSSKWGGHGEECVSAITNNPNQELVSGIDSGHMLEGCFFSDSSMMQNFPHIEEMKEHGTVYPNCRNILKTLIKLNEGRTAFWWLLKRWVFFPLSAEGLRWCKTWKTDYLHNASCCWPAKTCRFSSTVYVRAFNQPSCRHAIFLHAVVSASSATLFPLFSLDFPLLSISNMFALLSVGYDASESQASKIRNMKSESCMESLVFLQQRTN